MLPTPPRWLIPPHLRFSRILTQRHSKVQSYLLTFPLEITNKDYVARVLKITESAMRVCIDECSRDKRFPRDVDARDEVKAADDIFYLCKHMLNEKRSEFFAGRFDDVLTARLERMLEERDECCLIGNVFVTQSTSTAHSLCAALVMVILHMRQELMHAAPGHSIGSDRVRLLIDASVLL